MTHTKNTCQALKSGTLTTQTSDTSVIVVRCLFDTVFKKTCVVLCLSFGRLSESQPALCSCPILVKKTVVSIIKNIVEKSHILEGREGVRASNLHPEGESRIAAH